MQKSLLSGVFGFVSIIAFGGCGTESGRAALPPPTTSASRGPFPIDPGSEPTNSATNTDGKLPNDSKLNLPVKVLVQAPAVKTSDSELDPLVSYLRASFLTPMKDGRRLVITLMTGTSLVDGDESYQEFIDKLLRQSSAQVPAEIIRDFGEKNRDPSSPWDELRTHLTASLMTSDEQKEIFSGDGDGWIRFYTKYPDAYGIIGVSRVGLNTTKTLAMMYIEEARGRFMAHGRFHVFKKEGNIWVELPVSIGSSWTA